MTWQKELYQNLRSKMLIKRTLQGAGIAFLLMIIFLFVVSIVGDLDLEAWLLLPISSVTVAGAFGGAFYFFVDQLVSQSGWKKVLANVVSVLVYIVGLYISLILALSITGHWD
jgi:hypothetical protein